MAPPSGSVELSGPEVSPLREPRLRTQAGRAGRPRGRPAPAQCRDSGRRSRRRPARPICNPASCHRRLRAGRSRRPHRSPSAPRTAAGLEVTKKIALDPQAYKVDLSVEVKSAQPLLGRLTMLSTGWSDPATGGGGLFSTYFSARTQPPAAACKSGKDLEQLQVSKPKEFTGSRRGLLHRDQRAVLPDGGRCRFRAREPPARAGSTRRPAGP